jgi:hypothetical protein
VLQGALEVVDDREPEGGSAGSLGGSLSRHLPIETLAQVVEIRKRAPEVIFECRSARRFSWFVGRRLRIRLLDGFVVHHGWPPYVGVQLTVKSASMTSSSPAP